MGGAGAIYGVLIVGEPGQTPTVREARISELGTDIRCLGTMWRDLGVCQAKQSALRKQVCIEREREVYTDILRRTYLRIDLLCLFLCVGPSRIIVFSSLYSTSGGSGGLSHSRASPQPLVKVATLWLHQVQRQPSSWASATSLQRCS